jgi:hypothetical protein
MLRLLVHFHYGYSVGGTGKELYPMTYSYFPLCFLEKGRKSASRLHSHMQNSIVFSEQQAHSEQQFIKVKESIMQNKESP